MSAVFRSIRRLISLEITALVFVGCCYDLAADELPRSEHLPGRTRSPIYGSLMVSSGQPTATRIGLDVLRNGGNSADAAIAVATALSVLEPMLGGPGGDVSILYWDQGTQKLYGLDSRGRIPVGLFPAPVPAIAATQPDDASTNTSAADSSEADAEPTEAGDESKPTTAPSSVDSVPSVGALSWTTPGAVDGWFELHERFGSKPWEELFQPAIELADRGFYVSPATARDWALGSDRLTGPGSAALLVDGVAPSAGANFRNPDFSRTLKQIAAGGRAVFYEGEVGQTLVAFGKGLGGKLALEDLAAHRCVWVSPTSLAYRDTTVQTLPTSEYGVAGAEALGVLSAFDISGMGQASSQYWHLMIEARKAALADTVATPRPDVSERLAAEWLAEKRRLIDPNKAAANVAIAGDVSMRSSVAVIVDAKGNACLLAQDLGERFGSGVVPGALGFVIQNRAAGMSSQLDASRHVHSRTPIVVSRENQPIAFLVVSGGSNVIESLTQAVTSLVDFNLDPQSTVDHSRIFCVPSGEPTTPSVYIESGLAGDVGKELVARGHVMVESGEGSKGEVHVITRSQAADATTDKPVFSAGTDPRHDASASAY